MLSTPDAIAFQTPGHPLGALFHRALKGLRSNVRQVQGFDVLIEGAEYEGIWLECGPHEAALYAELNPSQIQVALDSHRAFFHYQFEDGYIPYNLKTHKRGNGQIQSVVPLGETAWRVWQISGDREFLEAAYTACSRWDSWLGRYRDTRKTGLCEAFCEFDTGHDNSPRFHGLPKQCPQEDARVCPALPRAPSIAPDLSAMRFGGQLALARMARTLGLDQEAEEWEGRAESLRLKLIATCYDAAEACFFDVDNLGEFVRVRGDLLTRVLDEGVVETHDFETIYTRHIRNPEAFWTPYPLPSIAANDPHFDHSIPHNSWGGASQALTAMRAPRWFNRYGKFADLNHLMERWVSALTAYGGFSQQINPWTGEFDGQGRDYSPAMLVLLDFTTRLYGIRREAGLVKWGCGLPPDVSECFYLMQSPIGDARLQQNHQGATLELGNRQVARVEGHCQLVTDLAGKPQALIGVGPETVTVRIHWSDGTMFNAQCAPDQKIEL
jgi:hypothetical protein